MKRFDLVSFNEELLQKLKFAGIKLEDYKYCNLYREYCKMLKEGVKRTAIAVILGERYGLSCRQVYNIIKHLESPV
jgi:hypothetical protein